MKEQVKQFLKDELELELSIVICVLDTPVRRKP